MPRRALLLVAALALAPPATYAQTISTIAGKGTAGFCGDGGPAASACLYYPLAVAIDGAGNLFVAENENRTRKVDPVTGIITTVAGYGGYGLAVDAADSLFITDAIHNLVRRVNVSTGIATVVAGNGTQAYCGDGGPATGACLAYPIGAAVDAAGNLFIVDYFNNRIRRLDATTGIITTAAGNGTRSFCGDDGLATAACLNGPSAAAVDPEGNLFIGEMYGRVRRVDAATGIITTVAGNGSSAYCGDGGPAKSACLHTPNGVAVDALGNLFISTYNDHRIRRVNAVTGIITTWVGTGTQGFCGDGGPAASACLGFPSDVAVDSVGRLFIADTNNHRVRKVTPPVTLTLEETALPATYGAVGQIISYSFQVTNDGSAPAAGPFIIVDDKATDESCPPTAYLAPGAAITCTGSYTITQADLDAGSVTNTATATSGAVMSNTDSATVTAVQVHALALVKSATPASYTAAGQVIAYSYVVTNTGNVTLAGPFAVADSTVAVSCPPTSGLAPGAAITCTASYTTTAADLTAGSVTNVASASNGPVTSVPATVTVIAVPVWPPSITTVAGDGTPSHCGDTGAATSACVGYPYGVAREAAGALFITMPNHHRVRMVSAAGTITTRAGTGAPGFCGDNGPATSACLNGPTGTVTDSTGTLYLADTGNQRIRKITTAGKIATIAGNGTAAFCGDGGKATSACLNGPEGVAVAPDGTLYIADRANHRIRKVSSTGTITTVAGNGTAGYCGDGGPATSACLNYPTGVAVGAGGVLFISDYYNHRVRRVDATGTITTLAGTGTAGFCGDVGPATSACLNGPAGLSTGANGTLVFADYYNERVRKIDAAGTITTVAGNGTGSFCGDGGPVTSACLHHPVGVLVESGGAVLVADHLNHRVRRVGSPLASVTLAKTGLSGCVKTTGKVTLAAPAPTGGAVVTLASDNPHLTVPASLTLKAGLLVKSFTVLTNPVAANETAIITARTGGVTGAVTLTLKPMAPLSVTLLPNPVVGGSAVTGTVTMECAVGPGDIVVALSSSKPTVAWPVSPTVIIPSGVKTGTFTVVTKPVASVAKPAIKATANGVTKSKTLIINP